MNMLTKLIVAVVLFLLLGVILKAIFGIVTAVLYLALIYFCWKFVKFVFNLKRK